MGSGGFNVRSDRDGGGSAGGRDQGLAESPAVERAPDPELLKLVQPADLSIEASDAAPAAREIVEDIDDDPNDFVRDFKLSMLGEIHRANQNPAIDRTRAMQPVSDELTPDTIAAAMIQAAGLTPRSAAIRRKMLGG